MASLVQELATALSAGLPLVPALRTIAKQGRSPAQRAMLASLIDHVEHGKSLSDSMQQWGSPFTTLLISLVRSGEVSGKLPEVLAQAASLLERDLKLRRALLGALLYPAIIAAAVTIAVIIVVTIIVPRVLAAVSSQLVTLPLPTRIVQGVAGFVGSWWWALALGIAAALMLLRSAYASPGPRLAIDSFLLNVPALGRLLRDAAVARFTRTLATLVSAGLPVVASLRVTRDTLGNAALQKAIDRVCEAVQSGRTIAEPLEREGLFPPLLVQIVSLGEQTGRLGEVLTHAAHAFEERTEQSLKLLTTILPPALIVILSGVVGFVVVSILLPLLELQESIG